MAGKLLPDELWHEIAGLFPVYQPSPDGGRTPKGDRQVLTAILFVLKTGIAWEDLPQDAFDCSYKTCSLVKAPLGGPKRGQIPRTADARGASIAC